MSRLTNSPGFASKLLHSSKMPAFTLYGTRGSTNTDRVRLTLAEGDFTDYELVLLNLQKGEQKVGDPFLLEDDTASPCVSKFYIKSSLKNSSHSLTICSPACNVRFWWRANAVAPSPKNTRNVTRGVKYPQSLPPRDSPSTRVAQSANISQRSTPFHFYPPNPTSKLRRCSTRRSAKKRSTSQSLRVG